MSAMFWRAVTERGGRELVGLDSAIRTPLPISRRIAFMGTTTGSGVSVLAGRTGATIAARRGGRVLLVNAEEGEPSALWHAGGAGPTFPPVDQPVARPGLETRTLRIPNAIDWWREAGDRQHVCDVSITDWGLATENNIGDILAISHVVTIVATADRTSIQRAVDLAQGVEAVGKACAVVAINDARGTAHRAVRLTASKLPVPGVFIPYDDVHASSKYIRTAALRTPSTMGFLRLAAALIEQAAMSKGRANFVAETAL